MVSKFYPFALRVFPFHSCITFCFVLIFNLKKKIKTKQNQKTFKAFRDASKQKTNAIILVFRVRRMESLIGLVDQAVGVSGFSTHTIRALNAPNSKQTKNSKNMQVKKERTKRWGLIALELQYLFGTHTNNTHTHTKTEFERLCVMLCGYTCITHTHTRKKMNDIRERRRLTASSHLLPFLFFPLIIDFFFHVLNVEIAFVDAAVYFSLLTCPC